MDYAKGIRSECGKYIYFLGVIDILTYYSYWFIYYGSSIKKLEYFTKSIAFGKTISAIPPKQYSKRY